MKKFTSLEPIIQYYIIAAVVIVLYGVYALLDKLIDKL
jgi:predicted benzoate:H+ symporter BenE